MLPNFSYLRVESLQQAFDHLSTGQARIHAGGTDLLGCLRDGVFQTSKLVSLSRLRELSGIRTETGGIRIGAMTKIAELSRNPLIAESYPALAQAAGLVASPQLRNQGTIGGNLCQKPRCWYYRGEFRCLRKGGEACYAVGGDNRYHCIFGGDSCYIVHPSDTAPALIALDATIRVAGPSGARTVSTESFFVPPSQDPTRETVLQPGEIVTDVFLPKAAPGTLSSYRKVRARNAWDFAIAGVALAVQFRQKQVVQCRIVLSGVAPVPWRVKAVEQLLTGQPLTPELITRAADAAVKDAEPLDRNVYKVAIVRGLIEQQLAGLVAGQA